MRQGLSRSQTRRGAGRPRHPADVAIENEKCGVKSAVQRGVFVLRAEVSFSISRSSCTFFMKHAGQSSVGCMNLKLVSCDLLPSSKWRNQADVVATALAILFDEAPTSGAIFTSRTLPCCLTTAASRLRTASGEGRAKWPVLQLSHCPWSPAQGLRNPRNSCA